jgi:hypothetical protein
MYSDVSWLILGYFIGLEMWGKKCYSFALKEIVQRPGGKPPAHTRLLLLIACNALPVFLSSTHTVLFVSHVPCCTASRKPSSLESPTHPHLQQFYYHVHNTVLSFVTALIYLIFDSPSLVVVSRLPWPGWPHHATHTHQSGVGNQPRPGLAKGADVTHSLASPPGLARGSCERIPPPRANKRPISHPPVASRFHVQ